MRRSWVVLLVAIAGAVSGCDRESASEASERAAPSAATATEKLDCGSTQGTAKQALRTFLSRLRSDDEAAILPLMAEPRRFFAMSVGFQNGTSVVNAQKRKAAARQIAEYGGLRLRIDRFMHAEKPSRTTDFGFWATWKGHRPATGKAALDCKAGTAIVLSVGIGQ